MVKTTVRGTVYGLLALSTLGYLVGGIWVLAVVW